MTVACEEACTQAPGGETHDAGDIETITLDDGSITQREQGWGGRDRSSLSQDEKHSRQ